MYIHNTKEKIDEIIKLPAHVAPDLFAACCVYFMYCMFILTLISKPASFQAS